MSFEQPLILDGSGRKLQETRLGKAVINSLFSWSRARPGDELPTPESPRMGWWGDTYAGTEGDRFGSRLWLLSRETLTSATVAKARDLAQEALAWLTRDGIASRVTVEAERHGTDTLALRVLIDQPGGERLDIRFADIWSAIRG